MNKIFSFLIFNPLDTPVIRNKKIAYLTWFVTTYPKTEFIKEELLFWHFLNYCAILNQPAKESNLRVFVDSEVKKLITKNKIKIKGTEEIQFDDAAQIETATRITKEALMSAFYSLQENPVDVDDFVGAVDFFRVTKLQTRMIELYNHGFAMMNNLKDGSIGAQDALDYTGIEVQLISDIYDRENIEDLIYENGLTQGALFERLTGSGIGSIDRDCRGIHRTQLYGVEAGPGVGKTRFCTGAWMYNAAVFDHLNVLYFTLEQTKDEITSMLIARHVYTLKKIIVSDSMILEGTVPDEYKAIVEAARIDLFESGAYGKIHIVETDLYVNSFIQKIQSLDSLHGPFDMIIIDYMGLIGRDETKRGSTEDYTIISTAFRLFKRYVRKTRKCGIAISQLNRAGIDNAENDRKIRATDAEGGIAVYRNTDYNMTLTMTDAMKAQKKRKVQSPKQRSAVGYDSIILDLIMDCCYFFEKVRKIA